MIRDSGSLRQAQDRQGRDSKVFEIMFLGFATHLAIPALSRDLLPRIKVFSFYTDSLARSLSVVQ